MAKIKRALILVVYNCMALSNDCEPKVVDFKNIESLSKDISKVVQKYSKPWSSATASQIKNAYCKKELPTIEQMINNLTNDGTLDQKKTINFKGITLKDTSPLLLNSFMKLIKKGDVINIDLTKYKNCNKVVCLAEKIFGKERGIKLLYLIQNYGLNASHLAYDGARPWRKGEIDSYIQGVIDLPSFIFPISRNKKFIQSDSKDVDALANAAVTFFSGLDSHSEEEKSYTVLHELSHYIAAELELTRSPKWLTIGAWKTDLKKKYEIEQKRRKQHSHDHQDSPKEIDFSINIEQIAKTKIFQPTLETEGLIDDMLKKGDEDEIFYKASVSSTPEKIISLYAQTNPSEDLAESISAYRYNPFRLKVVSPKKYAFLKEKIFGGIEYTSPINCQENKSVFHKYLKQFERWKSSIILQDLSIPEEYKKTYCFNVEEKECEAINRRKFLKKNYIESLDLPASEKENLKAMMKIYSQ